MGMATVIAKLLDGLRTRGGLKGIDVANITAMPPANCVALDSRQDISTS
jgi:hypothetical protein